MSLPRGTGGGPAARAAQSLLDAESRSVNRADLIDRARIAYEEVGRGVVILLREDAEPRYVPAAAVKERLAEAQVEPDILFGVVYAVGKYEPRGQAVLLLEQEECFTVSIIGYNRTETVGSLGWSSVN